MKTYLTYGLFLALGLFALNLVLFIAGYHSDPLKMQSVQWISLIALIAVFVLFLVLGTKAKMALTPVDKPFGYGQAFVAGLMITIFAALIGIITGYLYAHVINPNFADVMAQMQTAKLEAAGKTSAQIEQMQHASAFMRNPIAEAIFGLIAVVFFGTILSLITSIFVRRKYTQPPLVA